MPSNTSIATGQPSGAQSNPCLLYTSLGDNIERCAEAREARVGVPDLEVSHPYDNRTENIGEIAEDQEFGTRDIPPRSFIGRAAFVHGEGAAGVVLSLSLIHI